ncbi:hypothetical protein LTR36_005071 [Oleoguttula mirabilis]|uniref:Uncharacterized protein n=1 Tax=Oleoguttula mirabilis TaxID=1507867 RepID=A0AAV9JW07_9PEZI|nr:hypothetical protein LTR36_005071 [Oleoguttula mirabilis]
MATTNTTDAHDDCWKLSCHRDLTAKEMREELEARGYHVGSIMDKDRLREHLRRSDLGLMSYYKCTNEELRQLIEARQIDISSYTDKHRIGPRQDLTHSLDRADMHPKFHGFTKLPAELRNQIYGYHLADFQKSIYAPSQPPLSKTCRLIRQEFIPLFYGTCCFEVRLLRICGQRVTMSDRMLLWLRSTAAEHIALIRHLHLSIAYEKKGMLHAEFDLTDPLVTCSIYLGRKSKTFSIWSSHYLAQGVQQAAAVARKKEMEKNMRAAMARVVRRAGKNNLRIGDIFALRRAVEAGYEE